jgi:hypothetical protein
LQDAVSGSVQMLFVQEAGDSQVGPFWGLQAAPSAAGARQLPPSWLVQVDPAVQTKKFMP